MDYIMNAEQAVKELQLAMRKTKDRRLFERYQAILLHLNGERKKIANIFSLSFYLPTAHSSISLRGFGNG